MSEAKNESSAKARTLSALLNAEQEAEEKWYAEQAAKCGDYNNPTGGCPNCGRSRVMLGDDGKHRCEKCSWCVEGKGFDYDLMKYQA